MTTTPVAQGRRRGHSVQGHLLAVEEVRRILRLHAAGE